jgi:hypothetical protein
MSSLTLPTSGSMRNGQLSEQPTLERPIDENDYSSLPTPKARDHKDQSFPPRLLKEDWDGGSQLPRVIAMMPTPSTRDHKDQSLPPRMWGAQAQHHNQLPAAIAILFPTPTVNDMGAGKDPQKWQEWTEQMRQKHGNGNGHGRSLEQEAVSIGADTSQPSGNGKTFSEDLHPTPPLWEHQTDTD